MIWPKISNLFLFLALVAGSGLFLSCETRESPESRPNVIVLVSDDQGYGDFSAYGGAETVDTPNLDRLAARGTRFTNAYVTAPICSPSRVALLTGRYQQRWGSYGYSSVHLPQEEITLAELLQDQGYATGIVGKAHYGSPTGPTSSHFPLNHGFDTFYGREEGTIDYVRHSREAADKYPPDLADHMGVGPFWDDSTEVEPDGYSTDLFTERALQFIEDHRDEPFFLMLSYNEVHLFTHQLSDEHLERHDLDKVPELQAGSTRDEYLDWYVNTVAPNTPDGRKRYLIHLNELDASVGKVLDKLEDEQLTENTLVVYLSDNGGSPRTYADNAPLSGNKYTLAEGGIRVPFLISWPDHLPEGKTSDELVTSLDVVPTVAGALGVDLPADRTYDGIDLMPHLRQERAELDRSTLYWTGFKPFETSPPDHPEGSPQALLHERTGDSHGWAVRDDEYKLRFLGETREFKLYNVAEDPGEHHDLSDQMPQKVSQMRKDWEQWFERVGR